MLKVSVSTETNVASGKRFSQVFKHPPERDPRTSMFRFLNPQPWQKGSSIHAALAALHAAASAHGFCMKCGPGQQTDHLWRDYFYQSCLFYHIVSSVFRSAEQPHGAMTPSAPCRINDIFPTSPKQEQRDLFLLVFVVAGFQPPVTTSGVASTSVGTRKGTGTTKSCFLMWLR